MKRTFILAALPAVVIAVTAAATVERRETAPPADKLVLEASLSLNNLRVIEGDSVVADYMVSVGKDPHPTPRGTFKIRKLVWNPRWVPPDEKWAKGKTAKGPGDADNPMKTVKIFFREPDYYIHGTGAVESLGSAASHGCLRMDPDDAAQVAKWVMEHGGEPREENWFMRIIHSRREEKVIYLKNPVTIRIIE